MVPFYFQGLNINTNTNFQKPCHEWSPQLFVLQLFTEVIVR